MMPRLLLLTLLIPLLTSTLAAEFPKSVQPFFEQHCFKCHDDFDAEGDLNLLDLKFNPSNPQNLRTWSHIFDRVSSGEMPPKKEARPEAHELKQFTDAAAAALDEVWKEIIADRGRTINRRLNPTEYEHTLRDLLAAPWLELKEMLPPDPESHGFDNVAEAQEISYVQLARYLEAAEVAIDGAMRLRPAPKPSKVRTWFTEEGRYLGKDWKDRKKAGEKRPEWVVFKSQPNSAQAPRRIRNTSQKIPGWYRFRVRCRSMFTDNGKLSAPQRGHVAWINTAAKRILGKFDVPADENGGIVDFTAWQRQDELLEFFCATLDDRVIRGPYAGEGIAVDWFEIEGPFATEDCTPDPTGSQWPSESYRRLFGNLPMKPWTKGSGLRPPKPLNCPDLTANKRGLRESFQLPPDMMMVVSENPREDAERLLRKFMARAYRRPPEESEVTRCLAFALKEIERKACFQDAMRPAFIAALCSPDFLYFQEEAGKLDAFALASRLSYLLWRSTPDNELLKSAESENLLTEQGFNKQITRLLSDPKSARFVSDFAGQWLDLRQVHETSPDRYLFPEYFCDNHLVESGVAEAEATFAEMIKENLPIKSIVAANFVMINERLGELYGIDGVKGLELQKVSLPPNSPRGGFLTQSSVLKVTANGLTTSPVIRGVWILDRLLGNHPPPAPPDAGAIEPDTRGANSIRDLLAKHSRSESCASCHAAIDPPGFALENFDVMGAWRDHYRSMGEGKPLKLVVANRKVRFKQGLPVDASGVTEDGKPFRDIHEFRKILLKDQRQLARNLVERFLTFATGAGVTFADRRLVEQILDETEPDGFPIRSLLTQVILSETFRSK